jgi:malate synthase
MTLETHNTPIKSPQKIKTNGIHISADVSPEFQEILTPKALDFVAKLHRQFNGLRLKLLERRDAVQAELDAGLKPKFLPDSRNIKENDWQVAAIPRDLQDRRVEITGPIGRKMVINALNSGASCYMADLEDSHSPTWQGTIEGQINLRDAIRREIDYVSSEGKSYKLNKKTSTLLVRPRGWHLEEKNVWVDGEIVSGSIFDFGLFFFHNAKTLIKNGSGPYFYLPKLENHLEARLWNDIFVSAQKELKVPRGTIRATVLIETILAVFEMDEILYELRDHSAGLNCGRWDYIFSFVKKFKNDPNCVLPDRSQVGMNVHFLNAYCELLIQTCHRRGIHAMGGMAPQIPIKDDIDANDLAMDKVRQDKLREVRLGHDGTWVAHPGLVAVAKQVFDKHMKTHNQIANKREDVRVTVADLLKAPIGTITEQGLRVNVNVGLRYLESWLRGVGCVPLYNLMEDAATAEISRSQVWQWIKHPKGVLVDGTRITDILFRKILKEELQKTKDLIGVEHFEKGKFPLAAELFDQIVTSETFESFLTLKAYDTL